MAAFLLAHDTNRGQGDGKGCFSLESAKDGMRRFC